MPQIRHRGYNHADLVDYLRAARNAIHTFSVLPNLAPGSVNTFNLKTLATVNATIDGIPKIGTLLADQAITAAFATSALLAGQGYAWRVEYAAGVLTSLTLSVGQIVPAGASDAIVKYLPMPKRQANQVSCGYCLIQGAFTPGTTAVTTGMCNDGDPDLIPGINLAGYDTAGLVS